MPQGQEIYPVVEGKFPGAHLYTLQLLLAIVIKASRIACRCGHNNHQIYSGFHKVEGDYELLNFER